MARGKRASNESKKETKKRIQEMRQDDTIRYQAKDLKRKTKVDDDEDTQVLSKDEINDIKEEEMARKQAKRAEKDSSKAAKKRAKLAKKEAKERKKFKYKHPMASTIIKTILLLIILAIIIAAGIFVGNFYGSLGEDLKISEADLVIKYENSYVYDKDGNELAVLSTGTKRKIVGLSEMSPYLKQAFISIEDERFETHTGVDLKRTVAAGVTFITHAGNSSFGGSTITQQLIKNITDNGKERSGASGVQRKIKEMAKAIQVEHILSKDQILELYLNTIFVGGNDINGVALGALYYFNKDVKDLTLAECAFMAGINNRPNYYNPFSSDNTNEDGTTKQEKLDEINKRIKTVLGKMKDLGKISEEEYNGAIAQVDGGMPFNQGNANSTVDVSYHTEAAIKQILKQLEEEKGMSHDMAEVYLYSSGLRIYTTQDTVIQNIVEEELQKDKYAITTRENSKTDAPQQSMACMTIIEPVLGHVVATGAGTDENLRKTRLGYLNWPTENKKSTGSSIKPLAVIAPGLQSGRLTAATVFYDGPTRFPGGYSPKEWFAGFKNANMTMRDAIAYSCNIPNVKGLSTVGVDYAMEICGKLGLTGLENEGLSLALGGLDEGLTTLQMAAAYAAISNNGIYVEPTFYTKVTDKAGNVILEPQQRIEQVISKENAYIEKTILQSVVTGHNAAFGNTASYCQIPGIDTAAKTGTTNGDTDRWLCGFTNYYAAAVWFGYEYAAEVHYPGTNPAGLIWSSVMKDVHGDLPNSSFERPDNIVSATICRSTGKVATGSCGSTYTELFVKGTVPGTCSGHTGVKVCKDSGLLATAYCTNVETRASGKTSPEEENGNWTTQINLSSEAPTESCNIHTKAWHDAQEKKKAEEDAAKKKAEEEAAKKKAEEEAKNNVTVPNVVGKSVADAKKALSSAGFTNVSVSPKDADGKVTAQSVKAGEKKAKSTAITLTAEKKSNDNQKKEESEKKEDSTKTN